MQAIILAAGMGRRLGEYTENNTKCMLPVNGERLIDRVLRQLNREDLTRIVIVVGYEAQHLIDYLEANYQGTVPIEYVHNEVYDKTNNIYSLALAQQQLQEDDTLLIESDLIFDDSLFPMIMQHEYPNIALVAKYETWMDGTMVCIDEDCNITNFVPKAAFRYEEVDTYYKTVNIYKFSKEFATQYYVPFLTAYTSALGNNEYYEQVLRVITMLDKTGLKALPIGEAKWYEIDDVQDLDIAETIFADEKELMRRYNMRFGGHWRFPSMLDFCYLVNPYFPTERMKDEMRANFDTLLTEYPSGMYVNSLLAGKYFGIRQKYVVVGNGAAELIKALMEDVKGKVGVVYPTFQEYPNRKDEVEIVGFVPQDKDMRYGARDLMAYYEGKGLDALVLINPDNPSGNFVEKEEVLELVEWCGERGIRLIVDESFVDFTENYQTNSLLENEVLEKYPHMIVVKSISKSYGVPGLRLGVAASGDVDYVKRLKKEVAIWNVNSFAEYYMQIFGKYGNDYAMACRQFVGERARFYAELKESKVLRVMPSQANYFLAEVLPPLTSESLALRLFKEHQILVKDCESKDGLQGMNYIRISVRDEVDNDRFLAALKELEKV